MRVQITLGVGLVLLGLAAQAKSQEVTWRAVSPSPSALPVAIGRPQSNVEAPSENAFRLVSQQSQPVARGQFPDTPPPAFPGSGGTGPGVFPTPGATNTQIYNTGQPNSDADLGSFWTRAGDKLKRCWDDVTGGFNRGPGGQMFQSDRQFEMFTSPVTNPFFFEDPRALTEIRPIFIWQHTPNANPVWNGGNNFQYALRGSVAITPNISIVLNRLGFTTISPRGGAPGIESHTGFSELMLGPKFTLIRSETSGTVAAIGLTVDLPVGQAKVLQNTGHTMLIPYFSIAQNFGRSQYGSFNFMNTTGYTFRTDNTRTEAFYSSFHLDYEIGKRFWPFVELNWRHYMRNGGARNLNFEGNDLANFGSQHVSGLNELTLAVGTRIRLNNNIDWGIAAEFNVLPNSSGRHLDQFRLTTDFIIRY